MDLPTSENRNTIPELNNRASIRSLNSKASVVDFDTNISIGNATEHEKKDLHRQLKFVRTKVADSAAQMLTPSRVDQEEVSDSTKNRLLTPTTKNQRAKIKARRALKKQQNHDFLDKLKERFYRIKNEIKTFFTKSETSTKIAVDKVKKQATDGIKEVTNTVSQATALVAEVSSPKVALSPISVQTASVASSVSLPAPSNTGVVGTEEGTSFLNIKSITKAIVPLAVIFIALGTYFGAEKSNISISNRTIPVQKNTSLTKMEQFNNHPESKAHMIPVSAQSTEVKDENSQPNKAVSENIVEPNTDKVAVNKVKSNKSHLVPNLPKDNTIGRFIKRAKYRKVVEKDMLTKSILSNSVVAVSSGIVPKKQDAIASAPLVKMMVSSVIHKTTAPTTDFSEFSAFVNQNKLVPVGILFAKNSYSVGNSKMKILNKFIETFKSLPEGAVIELNGHACKLGSAKYNMQLSEKRAQSIKNQLVKMGVDASKIKVKSFGENSFSQTSGDYQTSLEQNRRVNIVVKVAPTSATA